MAQARRRPKVDTTWKEVTRLSGRAITKNTERDKIIETMRQHRFLSRPVEIPKEYEKTSVKFVSPLPFDTIQRVVAVLTAQPPIVQVPPKSESQEDIENAAKRSKWLNALFEGMDIEREGPPVEWLAADAQAADGLGVVKLTYRPSRYSVKAGYPDRANFIASDEGKIEGLYQRAISQWKRTAPLPFQWRDVDALNYFPVYGQDGVRQIVLEKHEIDADALQVEYADAVRVDGSGNIRRAGAGEPVLEDADETGAGTTITLWEVWKPKEWSLWCEGVGETGGAEGILLDGGKNPFNCLPYFEFPGLITSARAPERRAVSILFPSAAIYDALNTEMTKGTNLSHMFGYPTWKRTGGMIPGYEDADQLEDRERIETGVIYDLQLSGDLALVAPVDMGRLWETIVGFLMRLQDQVGLSAITRGQGLGADASGYLFAQIASAAQGIYGPMQSSQERGYSRIGEAIFWCIENELKTGVVVTTVGDENATDWIELKPAEIKGYYRTRVKMQPAIPTNTIAQGNFAAQMNQAGLISKRLGREKYLQVPDPEAERQQIMWERLQETPAYMQAAFEEMMVRRLGVKSRSALPPAAPSPAEGGGPAMGVEGMPGPVGAGPGSGNLMPVTP